MGDIDRNDLIRHCTKMLKKASYVQLRIIFQFVNHLVDGAKTASAPREESAS